MSAIAASGGRGHSDAPLMAVIHAVISRGCDAACSMERTCAACVERVRAVIKSRNVCCSRVGVHTNHVRTTMASDASDLRVAARICRSSSTGSDCTPACRKQEGGRSCGES